MVGWLCKGLVEARLGWAAQRSAVYEIFSRYLLLLTFFLHLAGAAASCLLPPACCLLPVPIVTWRYKF